jgi:FAD:protein FMN transferase
MPMVTLAVPDQRTWQRAKAKVMGTTAELLVDGPAELISAGFARLRDLESSLSRFQPDSELERLNRADGTWTDVSPDFYSALRWCIRLYHETDGLFDPTIRDALERAGYDRSYSTGLDDERPAAAPFAAPGVSCIELSDRTSSKARLAHGARVDLGGVGKGLAADLVANELMTAGARCAFVSLGGDSHAAGEPPEAGFWDVPLLHPLDDSPIATHHLVTGGLVMSSPALRTWRRGQATQHHLIDPRTGAPADTDVIAVAVASASAARGEGLAKAAVVAGSAAGAAMLRRCDVRAWIVTADTVITIQSELVDSGLDVQSSRDS